MPVAAVALTVTKSIAFKNLEDKILVEPVKVCCAVNDCVTSVLAVSASKA